MGLGDKVTRSWTQRALNHVVSARLPENSSWMTPLSCSSSPLRSWWDSVTPPFSRRNSSRANRWSLLVKVFRVWESSRGSNRSSVSAGEARRHQKTP